LSNGPVRRLWLQLPQCGDLFSLLRINLDLWLAGALIAEGTQKSLVVAVTDDFHDIAVSKLEGTVRELEDRHATLIAKLSKPTEEMMLAGALAHNENLRPMRAAITASEAKKIFLAMIAVLSKESTV
jgi:hypothetical protein